jgi:hypothetical protein
LNGKYDISAKTASPQRWHLRKENAVATLNGKDSIYAKTASLNRQHSAKTTPGIFAKMASPQRQHHGNMELQRQECHCNVECLRKDNAMAMLNGYPKMPSSPQRQYHGNVEWQRWHLPSLQTRHLSNDNTMQRWTTETTPLPFRGGAISALSTAQASPKRARR